MNDLEQKAVDLLNKLEAVTTQYAPEVLDTALTVVQISSLGYLILGAAIAVPGLVILGKGLRSLLKSEKHYWSDAELAFIWGGGTLGFFGLPMVLYIWNWVGVFTPKLALAHKLLGL